MDRREFNNPLSRDKLTAAIELLDLNEADTLLDVGCGSGAALGIALDRFPCRGLGIDPNEKVLADAATRLARHASRVDFVARPLADVDLPADSMDAAMCLGATHAFGTGRDGLPHTLESLRRIVKPGRRMLVGEGYWKQDPPDAYVAATGITPDQLRSHHENVELAEASQLDVLYVTTSNQDEWDHFESLTWLAAEEAAAAEPENTELAEQVAHWRAWRRAYLRWGRDVRGFGLYVLGVRE